MSRQRETRVPKTVSLPRSQVVEFARSGVGDPGARKTSDSGRGGWHAESVQPSEGSSRRSAVCDLKNEQRFSGSPSCPETAHINVGRNLFVRPVGGCFVQRIEMVAS